ncbi:MFS transporter [Nocardioides dongxiaopingii]|uniref:MFS transporter n=1 Tax=Nocardioides sp. S-1144 TaxID=2582905 RepID=UPI001651BD07|nr:MFS transporter [Nocardioides sp. S-1144]
MKRTLSFGSRETGLVLAATCLVAGTYGLVRLAYGLFLPDIQASLGLGAAAAGRISSGSSVAYCVAAGLGLLGARWPRALVVGALLTAATGSLGMALAPDLTVFVPAAVLSSAGAGLASPALVAVVARSVAPGRADRAQAVVNAGTGPGLVAAAALALVLLPGWRTGFAVSAAFTAAAGVAVLLLDRPVVPRPGREVAHEAAREVPRPGGTPSWRPLRTPAVAAALLGAASAVVWTYGRSHVVAQGAGDTASTLAWMTLGVGGTATVLTARPLSSLSPPRAWLLTLTGTAAAIAALGLGAGALPVALVACALFGWGFVAATSVLIGWAAGVAPQRTAAATAALFITLVLGQAAGSTVAGVVADHLGMSAAFVASAGVAVVGAGCGWPGSRRAGADGAPTAPPRMPHGETPRIQV